MPSVRIGGAQSRDYHYCYDANRRLTNVTTGGCGGGTVMDLSYDEQGNLAIRNGQGYRFDFGNRLREVDGVERYRYDGHGRRVLAMQFVQGTVLSKYGLDGKLLYQKSDRTDLQSDYVYLGSRLVAIRETPITGGTAVMKYQHTDALGSPVAVTKQDRGTVEETEYEPYGQVLNRPMHDGPGYTGHVEDAATGLVYMQQRYYDPFIGRFLSVDPVAAYSNPIGAFNRYRYARNSPYTFSDPDGRDAVYFQDVRVLVIPVYFSGAGASPVNIAAIGDRMKTIQPDWGVMKVRLQVLQSPGGYGTNRMSLAPVDNFSDYPNAGEGANDLVEIART